MARSNRLYKVSRNMISACLGVGDSWGYSLQRNKGMPGDSAQSAVSWYVRNIGSPQTADRRRILEAELKRKNNVFKKVDEQVAKGVNLTPDKVRQMVDKALERHIVKESSANLPEVVTAESESLPPMPEHLPPMELDQQLVKTKEEAAYCQTMMTRSRGNMADYNYWSKAFARAFKQTFEVERDIMKIQLESGKSVPIAQIEAQYLELVKKLVLQIDRLPQRMARGFAGTNKIDVIEAAKAETTNLKNILYELSI